jgi:hypothetical protein
MNPPTRIELELPEKQAWAFAQFLKRITSTAVREFAVSQQETDEMMDAVRVVQAALAEAGYAPR